jgi:tetratricopeptide (TPR) repeat protein
LFIILVNPQISYSASGRRKHFLSHGPSVCSFGAGESVFAAYKDPSVIQYNPALLAYFDYNSLSFSRFNLFEGSSYNSGSVAVKLTNKFFLGISISNLSNENIEARENIYSVEQIISTNIWNQVLSMSKFSNTLQTAFGINVKYLYYDLYYKKGGSYTIDSGVAKNISIKDIFDIKIGLSIQNFLSGKIKLDYASDDIPIVWRLSSVLIFPLYYRFCSKDTMNIYLDLKYEDSFADFYGGLAYIIADKYCVRAGYYPKHFTAGFGIEIYSFSLDYAADFSKVDLINRLAITYKWGNFKNSDAFSQEVKHAVYIEKENIKKAKEKFKKVKILYHKKEYLRASDILFDILTSYPNFESPKHFYEYIHNMMNKTAEQKNSLDFDKVSYARGYVNYYNGRCKEALNDWKKYLSFKGENEEIREYSEKIDSEIKIEEFQKREYDIDLKASKLFEEGVREYNEGKWISSIKKMEKLKKFVANNNFSKTIEYYDKAKEYIRKIIVKLSENVKRSNSLEAVTSDRAEYDESTANDKYMEGLVLYAQGKYYEAQRLWELALRLNPNHKKSRIALNKLKDFIKE